MRSSKTVLANSRCSVTTRPFLASLPCNAVFCYTVSEKRVNCAGAKCFLQDLQCVDTVHAFLLKNRFYLFEAQGRDKKFWELQGLSLLHFFKKLPHGQFNFRFYLLLPFIVEARGHPANEKKQKTQAQLMEKFFLWSKILWRPHSCPRVARSCISKHRP